MLTVNAVFMVTQQLYKKKKVSNMWYSAIGEWCWMDITLKKI